MSTSMLLLNGRMAHTQVAAFAPLLLGCRPYRMTGACDLEWIVSTLAQPPKNRWWDFQGHPPTMIWPHLAAALEGFGIGWAYVTRMDYHNTGDTDTLTFTAWDPALGRACFVMPTVDAVIDQRRTLHPFGLLALPVNEMTRARIASAKAWQCWLDRSTFKAARTAHETLAMMDTPS